MGEIKSINIAEFRNTLDKYIKDYPMPAEMKRYVIKDILLDLTTASNNEIYKNAVEREAKNEQSSSDN